MEEVNYNLDYLHSISGGDQEFVIDMIRTFIVDAPAEIQKIKGLVIDKNWQKVGEEAHKFASSLLFLGLGKLKLVAIAIEESGINKRDTDKINGLLDQLETGCNQIIAELKRDFNV